MLREYDIYVPLNYNDGTPVDARKFQKLQKTLLSHFTGLTVFPQPQRGYWKESGVTYEDEIVLYRVVTRKSASARQFLKKLKKQLESDFRQEKILIVEREVKEL